MYDVLLSVEERCLETDWFFLSFVSFLMANAARGGGTDDVACRGAIIAERHLTSGDVIT